MPLDGVVSSPHRRSQGALNMFSSSLSRKQYSKGDELGSCSSLLQRHRFLLTALALLAFLCTIYLYFAVTLGSGETCSGLTGTQKALCRVEQAKETLAKGKLKFYQPAGDRKADSSGDSLLLKSQLIGCQSCVLVYINCPRILLELGGPTTLWCALRLGSIAVL